MKSLLVTHKFKSEERSFVEEALKSRYEIYFAENDRVREKDVAINTFEVALGANIPDPLLEAASRLKFFQSIGAGIDQLNLCLLNQQGITLCNSHSHAPFVAEFALSMLFTLAKKLHHHDRMMRKGKWWRPSGASDDECFLSEPITGKRIGFLGFGHIAQHTARMLCGFDVNLSAYDHRPKKILDLHPPVSHVTREEIIETNDIIFVSLPLTKSTHRSISGEELRRAKNRSLWIHISRGAVFDEKALYQALLKREMGGLAIDNWFGSRIEINGRVYPSKFPFHELPNILLSPYRALYLRESSPHLDDAIANLIAYADGKPLRNQIAFEDYL